MSSFEVEEPILSSPFEEPGRALVDRGRARRPSGARAGVRPATSTAIRGRREPEAGFTRGDWVELELVNLIRERLDGGARPATRARRGQRSSCSSTGGGRAASTALLRAARGGRDDRLPQRGAERPPSGHRCPAGARRGGLDAFTRYACKMATGSGKTTVMAMLAAWSILNKVARPRRRALLGRRARGLPERHDPQPAARARPERRAKRSIYRTRDLVPRAPDAVAAPGPRTRQELARVRAEGHERRRKVQKHGVAETFRATIKIGEKTTSGRGRRYLTEQALSSPSTRG